MFFILSGIRPPPPAYFEAVRYPKSVNDRNSPPRFVIDTQPVPTHKIVEHFQSNHVYQTLPGETVYLYQPLHHYKNLPSVKSLVKFKYINSYKSVESSVPLLIVEALPETLAAHQDHMGVKHYAQLEVIASEDIPDHRHKLDERGRVMCAEEGVGSCDALSQRLGGGGVNRCNNETVQRNGKAVLLPINGIVGQDRMVVESILSDMNSDNLTMNGSLDDLPPPPSEIYSYCENDEGETEHGMNHLAQASEHEPKQLSNVPSLEPINALEDDNISENDVDTRERESGVLTPLLQATNAQSNNTRQQILDHRDSNKVRNDNDHEYADSGYSDCNRLEFKEHVTDHNTDHVVDNVIYSEPEYSSSEMSLKYTGDSPRHVKDKCQRTLKRTNNGTDHTVYELSPSDSFYNSTDNIRSSGKRNSSIASGEGICKVGRSASSYDGSKGRQPLNREASVSFTKPLVVGPNGTNERQSPVIDVRRQEPDADIEDGEPLVSPVANNSISSIPSHLVRIFI